MGRVQARGIPEEQFVSKFVVPANDVPRVEGKPTRRILLLSIAVAMSLSFIYVNWNLGELTVAESHSTTSSASGLNLRIAESSSHTNSGMCLNFDDTFDDLVASSRSIYLVMPGKAAGTTLRQFSVDCVGQYPNKTVLTKSSPEERIETFLEYATHPPILKGHLENDKPLIYLLEQSPRDALIVYSYRDETERLVSAIRHVMEYACNGIHRPQEIPSTEVKVEGNECIINEEAITKYAIEDRAHEVGGGNPAILTCELYKSIEANFPRMVFMHYKQVDRLQKVLAKHHCPELANTPVHKNMSKDKKNKAFVRLHKSGEVVAVEDWFELKRDKIEWTFGLKGGDFCQGKTRKMEDHLFSCQDELLQVTGDTMF